MTFKEDLELSLKAQPLQDEIYKSVWPIKEIIRFNRDEDKILDIRYHIDVEVRLENGIAFLGQEKALRYKFASYNTFTMEFYQDRQVKERGEFFNLGAQFYLHGYFNEAEDGFCKWYLIKVFDFLESLKNNKIETLEAYTKPSSGNASFFYMPYDRIPRRFIYAKSGG